MTAVDIVITSCNNPSLLKKTLCSIEKQTFKDFTCIVVNDGNDIEIKNITSKFPKYICM